MDKTSNISLLKKVDKLTNRINQLERENTVLKKNVSGLKQENQTLKLENSTLKARLNSNSNNSSRPPSSDGYKKKPAFPKPKKGKQGGQKGHKGQTLKQIESPDKIINRLTPL